MAAGPVAVFAAWHLPATTGTCVQVFGGPVLHGQQRAPDVSQRRTRQLCDTDGDTIMAMMRMATTVAIEPVPHVNQLLGHHDFERFRLSEVDPLRINQDRMDSR